MKQDSILITQTSIKQREKQQITTSDVKYDHFRQTKSVNLEGLHRQTNQSNQIQDVLNTNEDSNVMGSYKKILQTLNQKVIQTQYHPRIYRRLNNHWFKVNSRLKKVERALDNQDRMQREEDMKNEQYEAYITQRDIKSFEITQKINKTKVDLAQHSQKHHQELIERRQREQVFLKHDREQQKRKLLVKSESVKSWAPVDEKQNQELKEPKNVFSTPPKSYIKRPLPTYQDACDTKNRLYESEYQQGLIQSQQLQRRTDNAENSHFKIIQEKRERFSSLDSKLLQKLERQNNKYQEAQDQKINNLAKKLDKFNQKKDIQLKIITQFQKQRRLSQKEKEKQINNQKKQKSHSLERVDQDEIFEPRTQFMTLQSNSKLLKENTLLNLRRQKYFSQEMKKSYIIKKHLNQTMSNTYHRKVLDKIQESGCYYNFKISQR